MVGLVTGWDWNRDFAMSGVLLNIGAIAGIWGVLWFMWDHYASAPGWLLGTAIVCLIVGSALS